MTRDLCRLLALCCAALTPDLTPAAEYLPLAVRDGRCEFVLDTGHPDGQYLLILGSLARDVQPHAVTIDARPTDDPVVLPVEPDGADESWRRGVREVDGLQEAARQRPPAPGAGEPGRPPGHRMFSLFGGAGDFRDVENYIEVVGRLHTVGTYCQVYVDGDQPAGSIDSLVADIVHTFDSDVYPQAVRKYGAARDVDGDGRFTILITPALERIPVREAKVAGFVRGGDFYRHQHRPFGNRCDMMCLNAHIPPGPFARTVLAHEYTHAVILTEHAFTDYLPGAFREDEEGWLNEALCHVAEDDHGYGWDNLDYRVHAYLDDPARNPLVVPDYYSTGLWRTPGVRGATYLFLRWCADRHGPDLVRKLVRSNLTGVGNLEVATGTPFATLFRQWTVATAAGARRLDMEGVAAYRRLDLHGRLGRYELCGPRADDLALDAAGERTFSLCGTSARYVLLHSPGHGRTRVTVRAEPGAALQVTLVPLPRGTGRLEVAWVPGTEPDRGRLQFTARGGDVRLDRLLCEPARDGCGGPTFSPEPAAADWTDRLPAAVLRDGRAEFTAETRLPAAGADSVTGWLFRAAGVDAAGRAVAGRAAVGVSQEDPARRAGGG